MTRIARRRALEGLERREMLNADMVGIAYLDEAPLAVASEVLASSDVTEQTGNGINLSAVSTAEQFTKPDLQTDFGLTLEKAITDDENFDSGFGTVFLDFSFLDKDSPGGDYGPSDLPGSADPGDGVPGELGDPLQDALDGFESMNTMFEDNPFNSECGGAKTSDGGPGMTKITPGSGHASDPSIALGDGSVSYGFSGEAADGTKYTIEAGPAEFVSGSSSVQEMVNKDSEKLQKLLMDLLIIAPSDNNNDNNNNDNNNECEGPEGDGGQRGGQDTAPAGAPTADVLEAVQAGTGALVSQPGLEHDSASGGGVVGFLPGEDNGLNPDHVTDPGPEGDGEAGKPTTDVAVKPAADLVTDHPEPDPEPSRQTVTSR